MAGRIIILLMVLGSARPVLADESPVDNSTDARPSAAADDDTHPFYSGDSHWAGAVMVGIAGLFLAAAIIGPIVRAEAPEAVPVAMSHEEDPAADRHPEKTD